MYDGRWVLCVAPFAGAIGCGYGASDLAKAKPTPLEAVAAHNRVAEGATVVAATDAQSDAASETLPEEAYQPPFPERSDPFQAPKQTSRTARRTKGEASESVELLGFADLGEPSAVLAIGGEVKLVAQGQTVSGVEVLKIAPPRAVLKRGRTRWTSSIE